MSIAMNWDWGWCSYREGGLIEQEHLTQRYFVEIFGLFFESDISCIYLQLDYWLIQYNNSLPSY